MIKKLHIFFIAAIIVLGSNFSKNNDNKKSRKKKIAKVYRFFKNSSSIVLSTIGIVGVCALVYKIWGKQNNSLNDLSNTLEGVSNKIHSLELKINNLSVTEEKKAFFWDSVKHFFEEHKTVIEMYEKLCELKAQDLKMSDRKDISELYYKIWFKQNNSLNHFSNILEGVSNKIHSLELKINNLSVTEEKKAFFWDSVKHFFEEHKTAIEMYKKLCEKAQGLEMSDRKESIPEGLYWWSIGV